MKVTIYNEFTHNQLEECCTRHYPKGLHEAIGQFMAEAGHEVKTVTLKTVDSLSAEALRQTDVLIWWGHCNHGDVPDETARLVADSVACGMGAIFLHSAHYSKPFKALMGTTCSLQWREAAERERVWTVDPVHPIAEGLGACFELEHEEMYGERFDIPAPDETVFISWFEGGEVFRSGVTFRRGYGKVFYFQPGHETHPTYFDKNVQKVLLNAVRWAAPAVRVGEVSSPCASPKEKLGR